MCVILLCYDLLLGGGGEEKEREREISVCVCVCVCACGQSEEKLVALSDIYTVFFMSDSMPSMIIMTYTCTSYNYYHSSDISQHMYMYTYP